MHLKSIAMIPALAAALLAGCAQTETAPAKPADKPVPAQSANRPDPVPPVAASAQPAAPGAPADSKPSARSVRFVDHTEVEFEPKSRELSASARETIVQLGGSAQRARLVVITGYAERRTASNAKNIALARAKAVKKELAGLGVAEKNIRIKFVTNQAKHAVSVDLTEK